MGGDKGFYLIFTAIAAIMLGVNYMPNDEKIITDDLAYVEIKAPDDRELYARRLKNSLGTDSDDTSILSLDSLQLDTSKETAVLASSLVATASDSDIKVVNELPWFFSFDRKDLAGDPINKDTFEANIKKLYVDNNFDKFKYVHILNDFTADFQSTGGILNKEVQDVYFIVPKETKIIAPTNFVVTNWNSMRNGSSYPKGNKDSQGLAVKGYSLVNKRSGTYLYRLEFRSLDRTWFQSKEEKPGRDSKTTYAMYEPPPTNFTIPAGSVIGWSGISSIPEEVIGGTTLLCGWGGSKTPFENLPLDEVSLIYVRVEKSAPLTNEDIISYNKSLESFYTSMSESSIIDYYLQD